jgi:hypothetical protein
MDWWVLEALVQVPLLNIKVEEPRVAIMIEKQKVSFLQDSGAHSTVLTFSPSPWSNNKVITWGISGQLLEPVACSWGDLHFCHSFLIVPEIPVPL